MTYAKHVRIENPIAVTENCRYCLMCRHVAPVGHVMADEAVTPHGIALIVASQRRGLIDWNAEAIRILYAEPDGGNCRAHCVTDQPLPAAIAAVRADIVARGLAPPEVAEVHEKLQQAASPYGASLPQRSTLKSDAALFVSDEAHYLWPSAAESALRLLEAVGMKSAPVGQGRSSGFLACSLGLAETARAQAAELFEELRATGTRKMFVLSAGDLFTFRQMFDERLGVSWPTDIELVDLASFLAASLDDGRLTVTPSLTYRPYAYVDPTHAVRAPERFAAVRALVGAVLPDPCIELFWRRERAHPVGSTALQFTRPDIAERLTRARLEDARSRGAEVLLCEDPGTLYQLQRFAGEMGLQVCGLYETLAEHLTS